MNAALLWNKCRPSPSQVHGWLSAVLVVLAFSACRPVDQRISAVVLAVEGQARANLHNRAFALTKGSLLQPGTTMEVTPESRLDLMLLPGIRVELAGESRAEIGSLRLGRDGDETIEPMTVRQATLNLSDGTLFASIGRVQTRSRLRVRMPFGTLSAGSGRLFKLSARENKARVASFRGNLNFAPADSKSPITIEAGFAADCSNSGLVAEDNATSALVTAEETADAMAREERLLEFERQNPPPFLPWRAVSHP